MDFIEILDEALNYTAGKLDTEWDLEALPDIALRLAISSYCDKLACERLISIMQQAVDTNGQKKNDRKQERKADHKGNLKSDDKAVQKK